MQQQKYNYFEVNYDTDWIDYDIQWSLSKIQIFSDNWQILTISDTRYFRDRQNKINRLDKKTIDNVLTVPVGKKIE